MITPIIICSRKTEGPRSSLAVSQPMRAAPHIKLPKIDTDKASRDRLVEHIEELEWLLDSILPSQSSIDRVRDWFGISKQRAALLVALSRGRVTTNEHLCLTIGRFEDELAPATVKAQIWHVRKQTERFGIKVNLVWGIGYQLDAESVGVLSQIIHREG